MSVTLKSEINHLSINKKRISTTFIIRQWQKNKYVYIMAVPVLLYYIIFHYWPMYGAIIAFKDFSPSKGILGSPWCGFDHFEMFFTSYYIVRLIRNTLLLSIYNIIFSFPAPIILALMLNEVRNKYYKSLVQTISYLPHFISLVVIIGMVLEFTSREGLINDIIAIFGIERIPFMIDTKWFRSVYIASDIWQSVGWNSIIYLAALSNINPNLYEAANIDGAGRWRQMLNVTLPGIAPTVIILLILRIGNLMSVGYEKIILMYNPTIYETADVISSFVYRKGILEMSYSYSTAIGLFNSIINFLLLILANTVSRNVSETSLW
ncbi:MAG: sugar ABC transporter permease [Firmicutes bacterium]|nr:sugar ABC transporter permease [Bacillota bacterium]